MCKEYNQIKNCAHAEVNITSSQKKLNHAKSGFATYAAALVFGLNQRFPTGGTRTPKGYEIEHQGVRD